MHPRKRRREKPLDDEMHAYDTKDLERLFGLPASAVKSLTRAGHVSPVKRGGRLHYSFQDLLMLRTASALRAAKISPRRINRTLQTLRATLPAGSAANARSLTALGNQIAIRDGTMTWESDSGQYVLALELGEERGGLHRIGADRAAAPADARVPAPAEADASADEHYERGFALEDADPEAARAAYEDCLAAHPQHVEARINLGRLLHLAGRLEEAERIYRGAEEPEPLVIFNLAVLFEDLGREPDAIAAYREALALDPQMADAHYNLARLHELARNPKESLRHLLAYRRLMAGQGADLGWERG